MVSKEIAQLWTVTEGYKKGKEQKTAWQDSSCYGFLSSDFLVVCLVLVRHGFPKNQNIFPLLN
jgi:hypothetical protein